METVSGLEGERVDLGRWLVGELRSQWDSWVLMSIRMNSVELSRKYTDEGSLLFKVRLHALDIALNHPAKPLVLQARGPHKDPRWGWVGRILAALRCSYMLSSL